MPDETNKTLMNVGAMGKDRLPKGEFKIFCVVFFLCLCACGFGSNYVTAYVLCVRVFVCECVLCL